MDADMIIELIDFAISMAQSQFSGTELARTLLDIVGHAVEAYNEHTGDSLDTGLITAEGLL